MRYVEAPVEWERDTSVSVFLAGSITGCPDWQSVFCSLLKGTDLTVLNPRRLDFPMDDPDAGRVQIGWEFRHLRKADFIAFWFSPETLAPIVLYELGAWSMTSKLMAVGVHPEYERRFDIEQQIALARPDVLISYSLSGLAKLVTSLTGT